MTIQRSHSPNKCTYSTTDLKLGATILASVPGASVDVEARPNSIRLTIILTYLAEYEKDVFKIECDYLNREAVVGVYPYNRALNLIRDKLRGIR